MGVVAYSPALVPLTWNNADKVEFAALSGVAVDCEITCCRQFFAKICCSRIEASLRPCHSSGFFVLAPGR